MWIYFEGLCGFTSKVYVGLPMVLNMHTICTTAYGSSTVYSVQNCLPDVPLPRYRILHYQPYEALPTIQGIAYCYCCLIVLREDSHE